MSRELSRPSPETATPENTTYQHPPEVGYRQPLQLFVRMGRRKWEGMKKGVSQVVNRSSKSGFSGKMIRGFETCHVGAAPHRVPAETLERLRKTPRKSRKRSAGRRRAGGLMMSC